MDTRKQHILVVFPLFIVVKLSLWACCHCNNLYNVPTKCWNHDDGCFEIFWVSPLNANGWNAHEKKFTKPTHFSKVYHEHFVKNPPFFHMKKTNCPKPFALAQTHLKMKDNQPTNFDLMSKKRSYNEQTRSSHISIISIKYMVGTCLWSWVFILAWPNCLPKSQPMKPKKYSHKGFLLMVGTYKTGPSVKKDLVPIWSSRSIKLQKWIETYVNQALVWSPS